MEKGLHLLIIAICLFSFTVTSCEEAFGKNEFYKIVFRPAIDPTREKPKAVVEETDDGRLQTIITWDNDIGADKYILKRSLGHVRNFPFATIYEGTDTSYTDTDTNPNTLYVYRLDKSRGKGNKEKIVLGNSNFYEYSVFYKPDQAEPNDKKSEVHKMQGRSIEATTYIAQFSNNVIKRDTDWYSITIPAGFSTTLVFYQKTPTIKNTEPTHCSYFVEGVSAESKTLIQNAQFSINNTTQSEQEYFFKIEPNEDGILDKSGVNRIEYTITRQFSN